MSNICSNGNGFLWIEHEWICPVYPYNGGFIGGSDEFVDCCALLSLEVLKAYAEPESEKTLQSEDWDIKVKLVGGHGIGHGRGEELDQCSRLELAHQWHLPRDHLQGFSSIKLGISEV